MQEAGLAATTLRVKDKFVTMTFGVPVSVTRSKKGKTPKETPGKTPDLILDWLTRASGYSIPELAQHLGKSGSAIERVIRKLRADGKLVRIGRRQRRPLAGATMNGVTNVNHIQAKPGASLSLQKHHVPHI
jgi:biotin operon repressor